MRGPHWKRPQTHQKGRPPAGRRGGEPYCGGGQRSARPATAPRSDVMVPCHPGIGPGTRSEKYLVLYGRERSYYIQIKYLYSLYRAGTGESIVFMVVLSKYILYILHYQRHLVGQTVENQIRLFSTMNTNILIILAIPSQGSNTAAARRVTNRGIAYGKHSPRDDSGPGTGRGWERGNQSRYS